MDKPSFKLVGAPCGHHGQYTFYKALRLTGATEKIIAIGDFFFVRVWQDSELVSIGELQLLWTDRVSDQTLVSLRLYFLPENTPEGRNLHGEDEVLAINEKVVVRADDLLSWICAGAEWRWGLRAVWRGACAPPAAAPRTKPLHHTRLDFSDVASEKDAIEEDPSAPGVVVFSYPRYCRYRALLARLDGRQADWLRDSLVAALGGYAAPTNNTRILYCKDTFEYPELEGHEFVCNHLAPRLKGRPRGRRRRAPHGERSPSPSPSPPPHSEPEHDEDHADDLQDGDHPTRRRLSLRNGGPAASEDSDSDGKRGDDTAEDRAFLHQLKVFYKSRSEPFKTGHTLKHWSLRALYMWVVSRGGYEAACRRQLWRALAPAQPARARRHYERFLLPFENHERRNGSSYKVNGKTDCEPQTIATIDVTDSPLRDDDVKILRTPSPKPENFEKLDKEKLEKLEKSEKNSIDCETGEITSKDELIVKNAEELNREFLESLGKEERGKEERGKEERGKISVKPVEQLQVLKVQEKEENDVQYLDTTKISLAESPSPRAPPNGHAPTDLKNSRPTGRSSLRAVRVKPQRSQPPSSTPPGSTSNTSSPPAPLTNFGIHHPPPPLLDDDIVEVPYKPKTPEIIDLDEYPESPQAVKKKKLDILKERGLEVTALPPWQPPPAPALLLGGGVVSPAQLFHMYSMLPLARAPAPPPRVIQASCSFGSAGPEKTVYGNPKDPFMPPPHVLRGPRRPPSRVQPPPAQDVLDLTCRPTDTAHPPGPPGPAGPPGPPSLPTNYTLLDGKAVVGSNLEITLVNKAHSPTKNRPPQKRSSNGKFMSTKTPTPPKETYPKYTSPSHSNTQKKPPITIPSYQIREDPSINAMKHQTQNLSQIMDLQKSQNFSQIMDLQKSQNFSQMMEQKNHNLAQIMDLQKGPNLAQIMDLQKNQSVAQMMEMQKKAHVSQLLELAGEEAACGAGYAALCSRLAGALDARQLALYRDLLAAQLRHSAMHTPTTQ